MEKRLLGVYSLGMDFWIEGLVFGMCAYPRKEVYICW